MTDKIDMRVSLARIEEWKKELEFLETQRAFAFTLTNSIINRRRVLKRLIEAEKRYHAND